MILTTKTSDQTRQKGHSLYLYSSYLNPGYLVLPPLLPSYSLDYLGRQLLTEPTLSCLRFFLFAPRSVCVCVFIKLHITAQSGPVILVILCHSQ